MKKSLVVGSVMLGALFIACSQNSTKSSIEQEQIRSHAKHIPLLGLDNPEAIQDQYIVRLHDNVSVSALSAQGVNGLIASFGLDPQGVVIQHVYGQLIEGFAAKLSPENLKKLRSDARVQYIEADQMIFSTGSQSNATWGIDRSDQQDLPLNRTYNYSIEASNVTAYIIDTGINTKHEDFGGRAVWGTNTVDRRNEDCHGHGSHVAGTVGGTKYGIAKGAKLVGVKVMDCEGKGSLSGVIRGIEWAASQKNGPAVANMSLGGPASQTTDDAVRAAVRKGLVMVVASGNDNKDACNSSPARTPEAITVNATNKSDRRSRFSNYGRCTDIFAPGTDITSVWMGRRNATKTISGTSMAAPHVAGGVALILAKNPSLTPAQVAQKLYADSSKDKISNPGYGSTNRLLFTDPDSGGVDPGPDPDPKPDDQIYEGRVNSNSSSFQPSSKGFQWNGGNLKGVLSSSATDLDLYLQKRVNNRWVDVAASVNNASNETIDFNAASGTYRWDIYAYRGSGTYTLKQSKTAIQ